MEKMKIKISRVEDAKTTSGKDVYHVFMDGTTQYYSCWSARIKDYIGKEHEFNVDKKEMQGQNGTWYAYTIKLPDDKGGGGGGKAPYIPQFKDTRDGAVLSAKTMVLAYCKDLSVAFPSQSNKMFAFSDMIQNVKSAYKELIPLLDLDSIPEAPKQAPTQPQGHELPKSTLSPAKIAILKKKMLENKFRSQDMVDYAFGACGILLTWDVASDEIIWTISEAEAIKLINSFIPIPVDSERI